MAFHLLWLFMIIVSCNGWSRTQPNFIILLTDDQDLELGSVDIMKNLHSKIINNGVTFTNSFISTPICCPSRSETMFGRYFHNAGGPFGDCMHADGNGAVFNKSSMFQQFHLNGYKTGIFGKFVTNGPKYWCPSNESQLLNFTGYDRIFAMCAASNYYQPKYINKYDNGTYLWTNLSLIPSSYQTSQIGNHTLKWLKSMKTTNKPFITWIGPHAPHEPAFPAKWYAEYIFNGTKNFAPRPPSFNKYSPDKHSMIANNPALNNEAEGLIDQLWRDRLKSLLSVDDIINELYLFLEENLLLNNTYIYYSSDHGYHLGEYRVPCFKAEPYESDVRVPTYMIGPNIPKNTQSDILIGNVDIYPTFLELSGHLNENNSLNIDGKSFAKYITQNNLELDPDKWRTEYLVEYRATGTTYFWICGIWYPDPQTGIFPGYEVAPPLAPPNGPPWYVNDKESSNFRMLRILNATHNIMYTEFVNYNWTQNDLENPNFYEMYNLSSDRYQLKNIYNNTSISIQNELHEMLLKYGSCKGNNCQ